MLAGDTVIAEMDLGDAAVSFIRPRPVRKFHETYSGSRHLLAMYKAPAIPATGRYIETGRAEFSQIGPIFFRPAGRQLECKGTATDVSALHCKFTEARLQQSGLSIATWNEQELDTALDVQATHLFSYAARLINEVTHPGFGTETVVDCLLAITLTDLSRQIEGHSPEPIDRRDHHE